MKRLAVVALLVVYATNAHSEYLYGITGNMAGTGHTWGMNIGPTNAQELRINGVYYQYTPIKNTEDDMLVHVRNKLFGTTGEYIFSETDDWSGLTGGIPITKGFVIDNLPIALWGDGSIDVEGSGSVVDASVIYSYKYNYDCITPLSDPSCLGYAAAVLAMMSNTKVEAYDPLGDENISDVMEEKADLEEDPDQKDKDDEDKDRLERILSSVDDSTLSANIVSQNLLMFAMTSSITMNTYYDKNLSGGEYKESVVLNGGELPDNKKGARAGLAQQILHTQMVNMQYNQED
tara:strand:- start:1111 stop:1980 length:870 start_codon:yes stop_codon:yes gene_type:complete